MIFSFIMCFKLNILSWNHMSIKLGINVWVSWCSSQWIENNPEGCYSRIKWHKLHPLKDLIPPTVPIYSYKNYQHLQFSKNFDSMVLKLCLMLFNFWHLMVPAFYSSQNIISTEPWLHYLVCQVWYWLAKNHILRGPKWKYCPLHMYCKTSFAIRYTAPFINNRCQKNGIYQIMRKTATNIVTLE